MTQTSYTLDHVAASDGQHRNVVDSIHLNVETAAGIGFGKVVSAGAAEDGCVLGGTSPRGVTMRTSKAGVNDANATGYAQYDIADVARQGEVWGAVSGAVALTDSVAYINASGLFTAAFQVSICSKSDP